jgi:hypothetical protein
MAISDAQFIEWMQDGRNKRTLLAEIKYYDTSEKTYYASNRGFVSKPGDSPSNIAYLAKIKGIPVLSADVSKPQNWGVLEISNTSDLDPFLDYGYGGREIRLGLGDPSWNLSDFRFISSRTTRQGISIKDKNSVQLYFHDAMEDLNVPVQTNLLADNNPIPLCYGECFNIEPAFINEDGSGAHYQVHGGAVTSITVRSGGLAAAGVTTDLPNGKFLINPAPTGRVTCDVVNNTYSKAADIVEEIITGRVGLASGRINSTSFSDFNTDVPYGLGVYIKQRANARKVIQDIMASVGGVCSVDIAGNFFLWLDVLPDGGDTSIFDIHYRGGIARNGISIAEIRPPLKSIRLGYQKNFTPQDADGLFGGVSTTNRELYSKEWSVSEDNQTLTKYKEALEYPVGANEQGVTGSYIVSQADADTESARRLAERTVPTKTYAINAFADPVLATLGDVVTIYHPRFGFSSGKKGRIVGFNNWQPTRRRCTFLVKA